MPDVYKNIEEYHLDRKYKVLLIVFDLFDMITDMLNSKKIQ